MVGFKLGLFSVPLFFPATKIHRADPFSSFETDGLNVEEIKSRAKGYITSYPGLLRRTEVM